MDVLGVMNEEQLFSASEHDTNADPTCSMVIASQVLPNYDQEAHLACDRVAASHASLRNIDLPGICAAASDLLNV
jgi:hypothetical protein